MDCYFRQSWLDKRLSFSGVVSLSLYTENKQGQLKIVFLVRNCLLFFQSSELSKSSVKKAFVEMRGLKIYNSKGIPLTLLTNEFHNRLIHSKSDYQNMLLTPPLSSFSISELEWTTLSWLMSFIIIVCPGSVNKYADEDLEARHGGL